MGDVYAGDLGFGFLVRDSRDGTAEPTIDEGTARTIVAVAGGDSNAVLSSANLFEVPQEEFDSFRDDEIPCPGSPEGLTLWQVKK